MADWWNNFGTGLGDALIGVNNPFGLAPPAGYDRNAAIRQGALNLGMNVLANGDQNAAVALGRGYRQAQAIASNNQQNALAAEAMMQAAEDKKREREAEQEQQRLLDEQIAQLPPQLQGLARIAPQKVFGNLVDQQFPDQQGGGGPSYYGVPIPYTKPDGSIGYGLPSKDGGFKPLDVPGGGNFLSPGEKSQQQAEGRASGAITGEAKANLPGAIQQAGVTTMQIDNVLNDPNLDSVIGWNSWRPDMLASNGMIDLRSKIEQLKGDSFLQARQMLKGGGQITDYEGKRADQAYNRMEIAIKSGNVNDFKSALADFRTQVQNGIQKLQATAGGGDASAAPASPAAGGNQRYKFNPATGELE